MEMGIGPEETLSENHSRSAEEVVHKKALGKTYSECVPTHIHIWFIFCYGKC